MKLATDEHIIKTYNYASVGKLSETLTVTSARVILSTEGKKPDGSTLLTTEEVGIKSIDKVQGFVASKRNILFLIFMALCLIAAGFTYIKEMHYAISIALAVVGLLFLLFYFLSKKVSFVVELMLSASRGNMSMSAAIGTLRSKKVKKNVKIKVDERVAIEIIEEIGALIVDSKANKF